MGHLWNIRGRKWNYGTGHLISPCKWIFRISWDINGIIGQVIQLRVVGGFLEYPETQMELWGRLLVFDCVV